MAGGDYKRDHNLSLKQKLALQYEERKKQYEQRKKDPAPEWLKKIGKYAGDRPELLDKVGQFCYFFGLSGIASWGVIVAVPYLYDDYNEWFQVGAQGFGVFCAFQLMMNWICIRFIKSDYNPIVHGVMPSELKIGEHINKSEVLQNGDCSVLVSSETSETVGRRNTVYVATEMPKAFNEPPKRTAFPYWSWVPCLRCNRPRPPRCHHCTICNVCVMKRDHHCFIAGACVGYRNFRHFTVFIFWAVIAATFATIHMLPYTYYYIGAHQTLRYLDLILPFTLIRAVFGFIEWKYVLLLILAYSLIIYNIWSMFFLRDLLALIKDGTTSFENSLKLKVFDSRCLRDKLRSVFGYYWMCNFLIPLHFIWEPVEDPVNWPYVKA